jgi:DNA-binding NarL/FixJ family response regulator
MRVLIVSAFPAIRSGLAALMRGLAGWSVAGELAPGALATRVGIAPSLAPVGESPDVVLFDIERPPEIETFAAWLEAARARQGVVLLVGERPDREADALAAGLRGLARAAEDVGLGVGLLSREATVEEIVAAISAAAGGLLSLDRRLAGTLWTAPEPIVRTAERGTAVEEPLTAREREVLQLVAEGLPNKIIAARLKVSEHTVKFHVSSIMLKLGAASRTEAVTAAARRGLLIL